MTGEVAENSGSHAAGEQPGETGFSLSRNAIIGGVFVIAYIVMVFAGIIFNSSVYTGATLGGEKLSDVINKTPVVNVFIPPAWIVSLASGSLEFNSPMYLLMPVAGFFIVFGLIEFLFSNFKFSRRLALAIPFVFILLALSAFYVALYWYFGNYLIIGGGYMTFDQLNVMYVGRFKSTAYFLFAVFGFFGSLASVFLQRMKA